MLARVPANVARESGRTHSPSTNDTGPFENHTAKWKGLTRGMPFLCVRKSGEYRGRSICRFGGTAAGECRRTAGCRAASACFLETARAGPDACDRSSRRPVRLASARQCSAGSMPAFLELDHCRQLVSHRRRCARGAGMASYARQPDTVALGLLLRWPRWASLPPCSHSSEGCATCGNRWDQQGICRQTTPYTCTPACAATVLKMHGIPATEQELAELCLTRRGTTWQGLYRGLKRKTANTPYEVEVLSRSADSLRRLTPDCMVLTVGLPHGADVDPIYEQQYSWTRGHDAHGPVVRLCSERSRRHGRPRRRQGTMDGGRPARVVSRTRAASAEAVTGIRLCWHVAEFARIQMDHTGRV